MKIWNNMDVYVLKMLILIQKIYFNLVRVCGNKLLGYLNSFVLIMLMKHTLKLQEQEMLKWMAL